MSRYIDADALKEAFEEVYPLATNGMGGVVNKRIYDIIDNAPTVEERPKGEWIESQEEFEDAFIIFKHECSNCKEITFGGGNFCPNCGADMRGDEE